MPGARLIINSRYFHIAQVGAKADGKHSMTKDAAAGLVNYVGTREGVELNLPDQTSLYGKNEFPLNLDPLRLSPEVKAQPATQKQIGIIKELLGDIPEAKNTLEYQDYMAHKTIGNATELISHASELGLGCAADYGKAANLVEYVGKRPGVDCVGEHGLFSSTSNVDIKKAQEEIANCKGNIWTHVISLRREDADMLGFNQQKPWRDLVMQKIDVIAKASNIPVSQLHWYAGMHNTTHHPHIHLFVFSGDPKAGHLTVQGIDKMKSAFSEVIFADERRHIYIHKDEMRNDIKQQVNDILANISSDDADHFSDTDLNDLCSKITHLAGDLKQKSGKKQYGWLLRDLGIRNQVNDIMATLAKSPEIQKFYDLYCADHIALELMYREDPTDITPIVNNKEFRSIKNLIIREAMKLNSIPNLGEKEQDSLPSSVSDEDFAQTDGNKRLEDDSILPFPEAPDSFDEKENFASLLDNIPPETNPAEPGEYPDAFIPNSGKAASEYSPKENPEFKEVYFNAVEKREPEAMYQLAKRYFYGDGVERDYVAAQMWYGLAAENGQSMAKYDLGKMYLYGIGIDKDPKLGKEYFLDAYYDFTEDLEKATGINLEHDRFTWEEMPQVNSYYAYLEYLVGRMRLSGEGVDVNYQNAFDWFRAASLHGHVHSEYMLAKMIYDGLGVPQNYQDAAEYFNEASQNGDKYASYAIGRMYYRGIGVTQDLKKAAGYFAKAAEENVPYADYTLAQMAEAGQGMEKSEKNAFVLYKKALDEFLEQEKQQPDPFTEFRIAKMYLTGNGTDINPAEGSRWLQKAVEGGNAQAQYELAMMYNTGETIQKDEVKAAELFGKALAAFISSDQDNPGAGQEYRIAQMYEKGMGTEINVNEAIRWYSTAAENGHSNAAYRLGRFYFDGSIVAQDYALALKWYHQSAALNNKYASFALGKAYFDGIGTDQDYVKAAAWFQKSSDDGFSFASYRLAEMYQQRTGVELDTKRANELYSHALAGFISQEKENPDVQLEYRIGSMYLNGLGTEQNSPEALSWFLKSAEGKNAYAAYQAAQMLFEGKSVPQNKKRAEKLYSDAFVGFLQIEKDKPDAQLEYRIASMYLNGIGTDANSQQALKWFSQSAENGNAFAAYQAAKILETGTAASPANCARAQIFYNMALNAFIAVDAIRPDNGIEYTIAQMFLVGRGTAANRSTALQWFLLCANKGNPDAQFMAGRILQQVQNNKANGQQAQAYFSMALHGYLNKVKESDDPFLKYRIGTMYEFGLGVERNMETAKEWYQQAAQENEENASTRLEQISDMEKQQTVNSVMHLFRALARQLGHNVQDSTTHKYFSDRKLLQKQRTLHRQKHEQSM